VEKALENASRIDKPTLILQGEADDVALPIGAKRLYESLRTEEKTIRTFPDADHGFLSHYATFSAKYDLAKREHAFSVVKDWLRTH
jgi:alpha-beta hydrolase superfamily lysophospholipase